MAEFNHNDHYHPFLLRQVPANCRRALDVGCGSGRFARALATRCAAVDAVDRDAEMIELARAAGPDNVTFTLADFREYDLGAARYDFVSCIACLHHLPLADALTRMRAALAPGGVLAVLGLSRLSWADLPLGGVAVVPNRVRVALARRRPGVAPAKPPIMDPDLKLGEIRARVRELLPGARIRRHLYWRYSLIYRAAR